ncbi:putative N-acetyltransferase YhbS [Stackebrandtia albiflava]|uniref:Putative N-acetyltransferase YhbS n=1 Tax=Stackebrandtia albiflava TaxID=406432 RepID=A0A562ULG9_9ACTN|nr:GNAT family N-acetyltransferase [Stackebrandtia albiflava]TWJ06471.1 putative N-acetyltransferase YhbS [Stackebrandtia albiflava]
MTSAQIRPLDLTADAETVAGLFGEAFPFLLYDAGYLAHRIRAAARHHRLDLVAEQDGRVVGFASTQLDAESDLPGATVAQVVVAEAHRRQGVGTRLIDELRGHWRRIGSTMVAGRLTDDGAARFAARNGFSKSRTERISHRPLTGLPELPELPAGYRLRRLAELPDMHALHRIDSVVVADIPSDEPYSVLSYDDWVALHGSDPRLDRESTTLLFDGDRPVAVAWLDRIGDRVWSGLTGTDREYRGRGLARLVKIAALRDAAARGATDAYTNNDADNAPMLAVNNRLGYRPHATQYTVLRRVS